MAMTCKLLETTLAQAREYGEPVIVHVVTEKGLGYGPAIADEIDKLHSPGSFDIATGRALKAETKLTDIAGRSVLDIARRNPDVIAISAAMISSTGLQEMADEMPEQGDRYRDRRAAHRDARGRRGDGREEAGGRHLLELPPARLRPDHHRCFPSRSARGVLDRPGRHHRTRWPVPSRGVRPLLSEDDPQHGRGGPGRRP